MTHYARAPQKYDPMDAAKFRDAVDQDMAKRYARGESIEMWPNTYFYVRSPNGNRWQVSVSNAGALVVTAA